MPVTPAPARQEAPSQKPHLSHRLHSTVRLIRPATQTRPHPQKPQKPWTTPLAARMMSQQQRPEDLPPRNTAAAAVPMLAGRRPKIGGQSARPVPMPVNQASYARGVQTQRSTVALGVRLSNGLRPTLVSSIGARTGALAPPSILCARLGDRRRTTPSGSRQRIHSAFRFPLSPRVYAIGA